MCLDEASTHFDGVELILPDAAVEQLLASSLGVEKPATTVLDDRHRYRPVLGPHRQDGDLRVVGISDDLGLDAGFRREGLALVAVLNRVACHHEVHAVRTQDPGQRRDVERFGRDDKRLGRLFGAVENLLARGR